MLKNTVFTAILLGFLFLVVEAGAALMLFHSGNLQGRTAAKFDYSEGRLATLVFARKVLAVFSLPENVDVTTTPYPAYQLDPEMGYSFLPNPIRFEATLKRGGRQHNHVVTAISKDERATGYTPVEAEQKLWIFGDSVIMGGGNNDEHSMAWLLQARFPDVEVRNFATSGHGNVQALLKLRARAEALSDDDVLVFGYGDYLNLRNARNPSLVNIYRSPNFEKLHPEGLTLPLGQLVDGALQIDMVAMDCDADPAFCAAGDPSYAEQAEVTSAILREFTSLTPATTVLAYIEGPDNDPVLEDARAMGLTVVDLRPDETLNEADDFYPYDTHPGPLSHFHFFKKVEQALVTRGLLPAPAGSAASE